MAKKNAKLFTIFVIIVATVATITTLESYLRKKKAPQIQKPIITRTKGPENAPIKIVEFVDFQCPACAQGAKYMKELTKKYPAFIQMELKYFPLRSHKHGVISARYAECVARQGKFWDFTNHVFESQKKWALLPDARPTLEYIAKDLGVDISSLAACLQDEKIEEFVMKNKAEGQALGVKSTPTYFINGEMVVGTKSLAMEITKQLSLQGINLNEGNENP